MDMADSDKDGVLSFEEFMHARKELLKKLKKNGYYDQDKVIAENKQEVDDLPEDYN